MPEKSNNGPRIIKASYKSPGKGINLEDYVNVASVAIPVKTSNEERAFFDAEYMTRFIPKWIKYDLIVLIPSYDINDKYESGHIVTANYYSKK